MTDPAVIWLEPNRVGHRQWCRENVWGDNDKCADYDAAPVKYIRADLVLQPGATQDDHIRHLQERLKAAERELSEAHALLRIFGREHTHAEIAPRSAFARAAELVQS